MNNRELSLHLAYRLLYQPYVWAGDDSIAGFDCSGFMVELLKSSGILPYNGDWNAAGLYTLFKDQTRQSLKEIQEGDLVFYGNPINHVEMCYRILTNDDGEQVVLTIGAMGGGSKTLTLADAVVQNAYIKIRPIKPNVFAIVNPY